MMRLTFLSFLAFALVVAGPTRAQDSEPLPSEASHIAILDHATGVVLHCKACDTPMPPASMSKLMTALIVAERLDKGDLKPDTRLPVSEKAWRLGAQSDGSHMFLELNSQVRVDDLLTGVVVVSANDACVTLAEGISGSEEAFVAEMNRRARELGLETAQFRNASGLPDPEHVISALDLAKLAQFIIKTQPDLYELYAKPDFTFNNRTQQNRNPLLGAFEGADGVKTGHTSASGYGLVGSAIRDGARRIVVFNGMESQAARSREAQRLMRAAFLEFDARQLYSAGERVGEAQVWLGGSPTVPLVAVEPIAVGYHSSLQGRLTAEIVYQGPVAAPIKAGDQIAELMVSGPGFAPQRFPLAAGRDLGRMNVLGRAVAGARSLMGGGS